MSQDLKPSLMTRERLSDEAPGCLVPVQLRKWRTGPGGRIEYDEIPSFAYEPKPLPPDLDWRMIRGDLFDHFEAATAAIHRVNGLVPLAPNTSILRQALWLREARISSAIEDVHTTALDMVMVGSGQRRVEDSGDAREAWNAMQAVRVSLESDLPFSGRLIKGMHRELMVGVRGEENRPGEYRDSQAYIGSRDYPERARFVPPPPGSMPGCVESCMRDLEVFVNREHPEIPAVARVALMHYQFETIHPFRDGNGRIGRALILHQLCRRGMLELPVVFVSGYLQRYRQEYIDRLFRVSADGEWYEWIRFFADAVAMQAVQTRVLAERLIRLYQSYTEQLRDRNAAARLFVLLDHLFDWPAVNAPKVAELTGVTYPTARKDIDLLVEIGVLVPVNQDANWGKAWYMDDLIQIIEATDEDIEQDF